MHLRELFAEDPGRGQRLCLEACGLHLDYAKHLVTDETLRLLLALAEHADLRGRIDAMFRGERINVSEGRAALHVALRAPRDACIRLDGEDVVPQVHAVLDRMAVFADAVRTGRFRGHTGRRIRHVVNVGIGGSDLGPRMACEALCACVTPEIDFRFLSNIDGHDFVEVTRGLDPAETLFVVCSKSFGTLETLENARSARRWCVERLGDERAVARHFVAVSSHVQAAAEFGIEPEHVFGFWDWVGGRYSLSSAVGLCLVIAVGPERFGELLAGMHAMDEHFRTQPFGRNLPVLLALLGIWYTDFVGAGSHAVLPYDRRLGRLPAYLQQLEMESNGKSVDVEGRPVDYATAPVVWGGPGTNGQHAFFQLLHQGSVLVPCDFIGVCRPDHELPRHHDLLVANLLAQTEALAFGRRAQEVAAAGVAPELVPHRSFAGNRPSSTILLPRLDPGFLGRLVALYEHKVFVQGALWRIDSFDQWGVELGKALAGRIVPELESDAEPELSHDSSTNALIRRYRAWRRG